MSVTREEIAAYADGELEGADRARVESAIAADHALAAQVEAHRALKVRLAAHFAPIAAEPVPERLSALLRASGTGSGAEVIDFTAAAQRRSAAPQRRQWLRWGAPALAASLALGILVMRPGHAPEGYAKGDLAAVLDTRLAANQPQDGGARVLLSFPNAQGELCRGFAGAAQSGIACRDDTGWRLERTLGGVTAQGTDFRQASSAEARLMAAMQDMAAGAPLDAAAEEAARAKGWRR